MTDEGRTKTYDVCVGFFAFLALLSSLALGDLSRPLPLLFGIAMVLIASSLPAMFIRSAVFGTMLFAGTAAATIATVLSGIVMHRLRRKGYESVRGTLLRGSQLLLSAAAAGALLSAAEKAAGWPPLEREWPALLLSAGAFVAVNWLVSEGASRLRHGAQAEGRQPNDSPIESNQPAHQELLALYEIAQGSARSLNLEESMGAMAPKIVELIPSRGLVLYLVDKEHGVLATRYVHDLPARPLGHHTIRLGERVSGWAAMHRRPIHHVAGGNVDGSDAARSDLDGLPADEGLGTLQGSLVAPLLDGDAVLGVLALYDSTGRYEDAHLRLISSVAAHVTAAVRNSLQHGRSQGENLIDPLTRLPNARYLFVSFEEEVGRALRQQAPLSIIELDVDGFGEVNERHGYSAGDRILREMARLIRTQLRGCDTCVRYAADEFIVIVPGVGKQAMHRLQKRIEEAIETHKFVVQGDKPLKLTVSMGSSSFPDDGKTFDALIAVADARMFDAKPARHKAGPDGTGYQRFTGRRGVPLN